MITKYVLYLIVQCLEFVNSGCKDFAPSSDDFIPIIIVVNIRFSYIFL